MENRRFQFRDRRQNMEMRRVPFQDSSGTTITGDRRRIPSRRLDVTDLDCFEEDDTDSDYLDEFMIR